MFTNIWLVFNVCGTQVLANTCFPAEQSQVAQRLNGMNPLMLVLSIVKTLVSRCPCASMAASYCERSLFCRFSHIDFAIG